MFGSGALYLGAMFLGALGLGVLLILLAGASSLVAMLGWFIAGVIGLFLFLILVQRVTAPDPVIVIDAQGIHDKRLLRRPVPWSALRSHFSRHASDPTVFAYLRANRLHLAQRRQGLFLFPYLGVSKDELPLVLSPVQADPFELLERCQHHRSADLEARVPELKDAIARLSQARDDPEAFGSFVDAACDALFVCPVNEGAREEETCYAPTQTGGRRLDLYSDHSEFESACSDQGYKLLFLDDIMPELLRLEVEEITFDRGSNHGLTVPKTRFSSLLRHL